MIMNAIDMDSLISCGIDLNNVHSVEEMRSVLNTKITLDSNGADIESEIILDLRDRVNTLLNYIKNLKQPSIMQEKNEILFKAIRDIKHYIQQKEEYLVDMRCITPDMIKNG